MNSGKRIAKRGSQVVHLFKFFYAAILSVFFALAAVEAFAQPAAKSDVPMFSDLPSPWRVVRETKVVGSQLKTIATKLQVPLSSLFNTVFEYEGKQVQINVLETSDIGEARKLTAILQKSKSNPRWVVQNKTNVIEFVVRDPQQAFLASQARYGLAIQPHVASYKVGFDAIPIQRELAKGDPDGRNKLFNRLLQLRNESTSQLSVIQDLNRQFEVGRDLVMVSDLQRAIRADWQFQPVAEKTEILPSGEVHVAFKTMSDALSIPMIKVSGFLTIDSQVPRLAVSDFDQSALLQATPTWPVDANEIQVICASIISPADSGPTKLRKLQKWFLEPQNFRYDGLIGSRYGTLRALEQKYGRCWDYSDLFVTMARCLGLPCRQVYGWLYQGEGHVWCDVLVDGKWQMVDPTSGTVCGSDYLPFCISDVGEFTMLYGGDVRVEWVDAEMQK